MEMKISIGFLWLMKRGGCAEDLPISAQGLSAGIMADLTGV
jgi:hypothetical protein